MARMGGTVVRTFEPDAGRDELSDDRPGADSLALGRAAGALLVVVRDGVFTSVASLREYRSARAAAPGDGSGAGDGGGPGAAVLDSAPPGDVVHGGTGLPRPACPAPAERAAPDVVLPPPPAPGRARPVIPRTRCSA